jgi:hypothetical protein
MNSKKRYIRRTKKYNKNRKRKTRGGAATPPSKNNRVDLPSSELDSAQEYTDLQIMPPMLPPIDPIHHPVIYLVNDPNMNEVDDDATTENDNISVHSDNSASTVEYGGKKYTKRRKRSKRSKNRRSLKRRC